MRRVVGVRKKSRMRNILCEAATEVNTRASEVPQKYPCSVACSREIEYVVQTLARVVCTLALTFTMCGIKYGRFDCVSLQMIQRNIMESYRAAYIIERFTSFRRMGPYAMSPRHNKSTHRTLCRRARFQSHALQGCRRVLFGKRSLTCSPKYVREVHFL